MTLRLTQTNGFTLLELMAVVAIVGILATLAVPSYAHTTKKARETVLRQNLFVIRDVLDQFRADRGKYPRTISELKDAGYLRDIPLDPITGSAKTWQEIPDPDGGVFDVHSGSPLIAIDGTPYNVW